MPWWAYPAGCCILVGIGSGWVLGYLHREFIELGRAYARLYADIVHLWTTGELRPGRLARPETPPPFGEGASSSPLHAVRG